jgi:protein SCO1
MRPERSIVMAIAALLVVSMMAVWGTGVPAHEAKPAAAATDPVGIASHPSFAVIKPASDFNLLDSAGHPLRLSQLRGRVVLLSFIYTSCTTTCPLLMQQMALLEDRLKHAKLWPSSVSFASVTVDPERDSATTLLDYARRFDALDANWQFLREAPEQMRPVLAAYNEWTTRLPDGDIDHPARVYLIDRRGNRRSAGNAADPP